MIGGLILISISTYLFSTVEIVTPYVDLALYMVLLGAATSIFLSPNASFSMKPIPAQRRGVAASVRSTFWNVGLTVSLNLAIWTMTLKVPYGIISQVVSTIGVLGTSLTDRVLFMSGLKTAYVWLAAINTCAIIPIVLGTRKKRSVQRKDI
jgi:hypothetical protein